MFSEHTWWQDFSAILTAVLQVLFLSAAVMGIVWVGAKIAVWLFDNKGPRVYWIYIASVSILLGLILMAGMTTCMRSANG